MAVNTNPTTFDLSGWLSDAHLPEESADVYKAGNIVSELSAIKRRIEIEQAVEDAERSSADKSSSVLSELEKEYERLLEAFGDSRLTVYVRAIAPEKIRKMRADHEERTKGLSTDESNMEFGYDLLAAAIVGVKPAGAEHRIDVSFNHAKVKEMESAIGGPQMQLIMAARAQAQNGIPTVDADFLLRSSGTSGSTSE